MEEHAQKMENRLRRKQVLEHYDLFRLGDPLAPTNVATPKYQIWVSLFPGGNFLAKFSYKFLHRWSCTQTAQIALEYYSHTMGVWKSIY